MRGRKQRVAVVAAGVGLLVASSLVVAAPASAAVTTGVEVAVAHSGRCLALQGSKTADGTAVVQHTCQNLGGERWLAVPQAATGDYQVVSEASNKCLNVSGNSTADLAAVIEWPCSASAANERWQVRPVAGSTRVQLVSERSGKCLDVTYGSTAEDVPVIQYTCAAVTSQQWWYQPARAQQTPTSADPHSAVAVLQAGDAQIDYAFTNAGGKLIAGTQGYTEHPDTTRWSVLGGSQLFAGTPALALSSDGGAALTAHGTDSDIWATSRQAGLGAAYGTIQDVGGASTTHASLLTGQYSNPDLSIDYAVDPSGLLWQQPRGGDASFLGWRSRGQSGLVATPAVVGTGYGPRLVGLGAGGQVRTAVDGTNDPDATTPLTWTVLPDSGFTAVTAAPGPVAGTVWLVAIGAGGTVRTLGISATGVPDASWTTVGTLPATGTPMAVANSENQVEIVVRGTDGGIYDTRSTDYHVTAWQPWQRVDQAGDTAATDPSVVVVEHVTEPYSGVVFRTTAGHVVFYQATTGAAAPAFTREQLPDPPS